MKYEDIKNLLNKLSFKYIETDIKTGEALKSRRNELLAEMILKEIPFNINLLPEDKTNVEKLDYLIMLILSSGQTNGKYRKILFDTLLKYRYCTEGELIKVIKLSDKLFEGEISYETFKDYFFGLVTMIRIKDRKENELYLASSNGNFSVKQLDKELGLPKLSTDLRRNNANLLTSEILSDNRDLFGAYYHIPYELFSSYGYSVILNTKDRLVYDCANNVIVPLNIWKEYYGNPSVLMRGSQFKACKHMAKEEFGVDLDLSILDGIQKRIRK